MLGHKQFYGDYSRVDRERKRPPLVMVCGNADNAGFECILRLWQIAFLKPLRISPWPIDLA